MGLLVQTREQFEGIRTLIATADLVYVDTETTGLLPHQGDRLCGVAVLVDAQKGDLKYTVSAYFPFRHKPGEDLFSQSENLPEAWLRELLSVLNKPEGCLVFHNAKFDLTMMAYEGVDLHNNPWVCTQIMSWFNNESESHRLKDLHDIHMPWSQSKAREETIKKYVKKEGSYDQVPPALMAPYACGDVEDTKDIHLWLTDSLEEQGLMPLLPREFDFSRLLFEMEWYGIGVDLALCQELSSQAARRMRVLEDEMDFDPNKTQELARRLFLAPPEGLGLPIDSLTKTTSPEFPEGVPACRQEYLSQFLTHPLVGSVIEYKGLVKANSTWFDGFIKHAGRSRDGRLHTTFNGSSGSKSKMGVKGKAGTVTGRLNSSDPNMQQIPRADEEVETELKRQVKRAFLPAHQRWGLFEFDYSQIELRLAAGYANATPLIDALAAGLDPHKVTAERIGCTRQTAKHATYTTLYGGGAAKLAWQIERLEFITTGKRIVYPVEAANDVLTAFFELYPGFKVLMRESAKLMKQRGYVQIWNGRRRHYEQWYDPVLGKQVDNGHKAFNSVIQGGAAEVIKTSMLLLPKKDYAYRVVSQVHDSLWIEVVNDFREEWIEEIKWYMMWPNREPRFQVPFDVDVKLMRLEPISLQAMEAEFAVSSH